LFTSCAVVALTAFPLASAFAETPVIGMASAQSGVILDNARVSGDATVFDGSTVQTAAYSRIQLKSGTRLDLGAGSKAQIFAGRVAMESGATEVQSPSGYRIDARTLSIQPSGPSAIARVKLDSDNKVLVTALNAPVNVINREGLLVARVNPGLPLSFMPQAGGPGSYDTTGCVLQKSGAAIQVDSTGNQVFELRKADLRKAVGNTVHVTGTIDSTATAGGGATQVVTVTSATITSKGGCSSAATKLGATTTAAGLAAGATAGVAVATGAGVAAGVGAAAGVSTAVIVGGVAAATAATIGGLAAAGTFSSSSPD
jgi:hypothetical protein